MRRLVCLSGLAVGIGLALFPSRVPGAAKTQEVEEMEQKWAEAVQRNDVDAIGSFLHTDFTFVNPRGQLLHRDEHLDDFRQKRTVFTRVELTEVRIRLYGDMAVVTSRPKLTGYAVTPAGKTTFDAQPARFTDTLLLSRGKWLSVARQMSLVAN